MTAKQDRFVGLAQAWLATGATTFSVWEQDEVLASWTSAAPVNGSVAKETLERPIQLREEILGKLRVEGVSDSQGQTRLTAEAYLVAELIKLEDDLEAMTAELVDTQDQLLALYNMTQTPRNSLNLDEVLRSLIDELVRLTKATGAFVTLNTSNHPILVEQYPRSLFDQIFLQQLFQKIQTINQEILLRREDPLLEVIPDDIYFDVFFVRTILIRNRTTVTIGLLLQQSPTALSPYLKLARALGEYSAAQLENILLYQETVEQAKLKAELELASRIQLQLLPQHPPQVEGLEIAARCMPALDVGGDFFDFIEHDNHLFTFVVGDVSGKGMSAALLMAMTRTVIRSEAKFLPTPTPGMILGRANTHLQGDFNDVGMFATVFVGHFDPIKQEIMYTNAGHSPVIYCSAGQPAKLLKADDPPLGIIPTSLSQNRKLALKPGDVLIVATDGFNEARNIGDEMFGYRRLLKLVEQTAHQSAAQIAAALFDDVDQFGAGCAQDDDQTILVIKNAE
ncbi:MAG: PP2C family protein-serine/threonine phosphatase [Anaerolineae bacterium]|nr:PP2C family protein-serine/threonine phosphatase [Anaerolineae bacterium]